MHIKLTPKAFKQFRNLFNKLGDKAVAGDFLSFNFEQSEEQLIIEIKKKEEPPNV